MQQFQRTALSQEQRLSQKMSPRLIQSLKLMELPAADLREKIAEELEKNPALEIIEDRALMSLETMYKARSEENDYFETSSDSGFLRGGHGEAASDEKRQFIEGSLSQSETLQDHLLWQLRLQTPENELRVIGEKLIQNINNDGFNLEIPETLFTTAENVNAAILEKTLQLVRRLEPIGCCTKDYQETLSVQAEIVYSAEAEKIKALIPCMPELERGKLQTTARKMKLHENEIAELFEKLKTLSPYPGRQWTSGGTGRTRFVVPDIQVTHKDGEFSIILNDEEIPVLGIQPFFMKQADKIQERSERDFIREKLKEARWFIQSINRRNHTLLRVTRAILEYQRSFFMNGPKHLSPLTLRDIACELEIHETTVSRAVNGKYIQTEWGIFEIRHFFSNSICGAGSSGSRYSQEGVKEMIREIIQAENVKQGRERLSDQDIVHQLAKHGIKLARRTVSKYRNQLELGSSYQRQTKNQAKAAPSPRRQILRQEN
ncbi:MAG: RNA polymerase factor sigma-54 [Spirochaetaceae bacterium]|jgi:RNA polymerase sigma-54 factor|nr:RNA polymerase factor sigma-54 [Spirochaetaceae bacterium]